jgi:hypothetical protein
VTGKAISRVTVASSARGTVDLTVFPA